MSSSNISYMLGMPVEILDIIGGWLYPYNEATEVMATTGTSAPNGNEDTAQWQADLCAMRLTCKTFSKLRSLKVALFTTFNLYPQISSLEKLYGLSRHRALRRYVKRFVFMVPQIPLRRWTDDDLEYMYCKNMEADYFEQLRATFNATEHITPASDEQIKAVARSLVADNFEQIYPNAWIDQVKAGLRAEHWSQMTLLLTAEYVQCCAANLANLPNVRSIVACGGDGSTEAAEEDTRDMATIRSAPIKATTPSYLERNYPDFKLRPGHGANLRMLFADRGDFIKVVIRTLAATNTNVKHISMTQGMRLDNLSCDHYNEDLAKTLRNVSLTTLKLHLECDETGFSDKAQRNTAHALLVKSTATLTHLSVNFQDADPGAYWPNNQEPSLHTLRSLKFAKLRHIEIRTLHWGVANILDLLQRHPTIQTLHFAGTGRPAFGWKNIFTCIRRHARQVRLRVTYGRDNTGARFEWPDGEDEDGGVLEMYLKGEGMWTGELERRFGDVVEKM